MTANYKNLKKLNISHNYIEYLEIPLALNLVYLNCSNNLIANLDLRNNKLLTSLDCSNNPFLASLLLPDSFNPIFFDCRGTKLASSVFNCQEIFDSHNGSVSITFIATTTVTNTVWTEVPTNNSFLANNNIITISTTVPLGVFLLITVFVALYYRNQ
jgi:hypothetical protein